MTGPPALSVAEVSESGVGAQQQRHRADQQEEDDGEHFHASILRWSAC